MWVLTYDLPAREPFNSDVNEADESYMKSLGFEELKNGMRLRREANVARRDLLGAELNDGAALAATLGELAFVLPSAAGPMDILMVLAFGLVVFAAARGIAKDGESYAALSPEAPPQATELDAAQKAALAGADARAIPTLDGMRGIAVIAVLVFHFAWTSPPSRNGAAR